MKKILFLLLFINIVFIAVSQEIGYPVIRNYSSKEYNSAPQVLSIIQNKKGFLYCGVGGGILEYDGVTWRKIPNEKNATPYDFASDSAGVIYVAANGDFGFLASDS
ncbi:MAG TPA: hypothetical protein DCQ31_06690, partial [Bacteroidales bacterium]|nr:hypothetical protein [Bacteroidales bacterium]